MAKDRVPGTYKSNATFESKTLKNGKVGDKALRDTRVRDEDYDYTKTSWPGKMEPDANLTRGESMQVKHKPLTSARTQT